MPQQGAAGTQPPHAAASAATILCLAHTAAISRHWLSYSAQAKLRGTIRPRQVATHARDLHASTALDRPCRPAMHCCISAYIRKQMCTCCALTAGQNPQQPLSHEVRFRPLIRVCRSPVALANGALLCWHYVHQQMRHDDGCDGDCDWLGQWEDLLTPPSRAMSLPQTLQASHAAALTISML
jgi:hypothetical protein